MREGRRDAMKHPGFAVKAPLLRGDGAPKGASLIAPRRSSITLSSQDDLDSSARRGVSQIREWREWLQNNLDMARRSKIEDGAGLVNIRRHSEGLVLVGRRAQLRENSSAVRNRIREESQIRIHTYDWLLEALDATLHHSGPPVLNPYAIKPSRPQKALG
jgi:hypothetical protein